MAIDISRTSKPATPKTAATPPLGASDRAADVLARIRANSTTNEAVSAWVASYSLPDDLTTLADAGILDPLDAFRAMPSARTRERADIDRQIAAARSAGNAKLTLKVSDKGAASLYGLGRWPVTLYRSQWVRLLDHAEQIRQFLQVNASKLTDKN